MELLYGYASFCSAHTHTVDMQLNKSSLLLRCFTPHTLGTVQTGTESLNSTAHYPNNCTISLHLDYGRNLMTALMTVHKVTRAELFNLSQRAVRLDKTPI